MANVRDASSRMPASPSPASRRKLARRCGPSSVSTDSGWNCTPSMGRVACRIPHHDVVVEAPGRHEELGRERGGIHAERVVAGGAELRRHPVEQAGSVVRDGGGFTVDERRGTLDRRTERGGHRLHPETDTEERDAARRGECTAATETPACAGSDGPAESRSREGPRPDRRRGPRARPCRSCCCAPPARPPRRPERLDEVVGEAVVVVDHEDHRDPPAETAPAGSVRAFRVGPAIRGGPARVRRGRGDTSRARRELERPAQRGGLVLRLLKLALRDACRHDPGARMKVGDAVLQDCAPDGDRRSRFPS